MQDPVCAECYCGWCGRSTDLVNCKSCKTLFCMICIKRNIGTECLSEVQNASWQCCCCRPGLLQKLTLELEKAMVVERSIDSSSDSDSSSESDSDNSNADVDVALRYNAIKYQIAFSKLIVSASYFPLAYFLEKECFNGTFRRGIRAMIRIMVRALLQYSLTKAHVKREWF